MLIKKKYIFSHILTFFIHTFTNLLQMHTNLLVLDHFFRLALIFKRSHIFLIHSHKFSHIHIFFNLFTTIYHTFTDLLFFHAFK